MKFDHTIENDYSYDEYIKLVESLAESGGTTGPEQSEGRINYTHLNNQRIRRLNKTIRLSEEVLDKLQHIEKKQTWIVVAESWCGDAAQLLPLINKMAEVTEHVDLHIVLRDENTNIIDDFLTNGGRAIPKLIALDDQQNILFSWGPRPEPANDIYLEYKSGINGQTKDEFNIKLHKWYTADKTLTAQREIARLL